MEKEINMGRGPVIPEKYWSHSPEELISIMGSSMDNGLSEEEADRRLTEYGPNRMESTGKNSALLIFLSQFKGPINLILIGATIISFVAGDTTDAVMILAIILISGILSFFQEYSSDRTVSQLLEVVRTKADVIRDGKAATVDMEDVVPGDIVTLSAGDIVPGDAVLLSSRSLSADESSLTGETYPEEKSAGAVNEDTVLSKRTNSLYMGTHVVSGTGTALILKTARNTEFGKIFDHISRKQNPTEFEKGIRDFGYLLMRITFTMVIIIFFLNILLKRPVMDSFLFSLALSVGLTPQLLPAIISVNLSRGARNMAEKKVIVKKLSSIENLGSMNILCSDKTGTVTTGEVIFKSAVDSYGNDSSFVRLLTQLNSHFQTGYKNPIDSAVEKESGEGFDFSGYKKIGEIPYNFVDKRLGIILSTGNETPFGGKDILISKGAFTNIVGESINLGDLNGIKSLSDDEEDKISEIYRSLGDEGLRALGVAWKYADEGEEEKDDRMNFAGFVTFMDPLKDRIGEAVREMDSLGVELKILTGDNRIVAQSIAKELMLPGKEIITGTDMEKMSEAALMKKVCDVSIFAETEPNQKERIILALKKMNNVVGYMGDGINDSAAIHAADVGISVNNGSDVAKGAAAIVLLEQNLEILADGIKEGRRTFSNTMKYIFLAVSANFGNMFSMAGASLFLPFLPLEPSQVLLTNLMTDIPQMQLAGDSVDSYMLDKPRKMNISFIKKFMVVFGLLSSVFDFMTFFVLLKIFGAGKELFQTGWFTESVISATLVVLVMRTSRSILQSRPSRGLTIGIAVACFAVILLPYTPLGTLLGFIKPEPVVVAVLLLIVLLYIITAEAVKKIFYRRVKL